MKKQIKRIDYHISRTASYTCMSRAVSYYEKKSHNNSNDYIAVKMVPKLFLLVIKFGLFRNFFKNILSWKGLYEYVIARTKYIDSIFKNASKEGFKQIVIFGAGFDSRAIRFEKDNSGIKIFELDVPVTQKAKIKQLKKRKIKLNPNITFISLDFEKESIKERLIENGFSKSIKSLFIMEGLLMYLEGRSVDNTFELINNLAGKGSEIIFDYIYSSVLREENLYYGEPGILKKLKNSNEEWTFGIEKDEIEQFLKKRDFRLIENMTSEDLEKRYFTDDRQILIAKINGTHCIVRATK